MGVPSPRSYASLETYSGRVNKSKITYQRKNRIPQGIQDKAGLLQTAVLSTPSSNSKQSVSALTDSQEIHRGRQHASGSTAPLLSSKTIPELKAHTDLSPTPTAPQKSKPLGDNSPLPPPGKRVSELSTPRQGVGKNNSTTSKDSRALRDITNSQPSKKRAYNQHNPPQDELPPTKKPKQSITSYFKPLPRSSSPLVTHCPNLSDNSKSSPTPPSSPPPRVDSPISHTRKPQKRRLTTKPSLPPISVPSRFRGRFEVEEDFLSFDEVFGDAAYENRVELAEQALDREEARDTFLTTPSDIPRSAHADMVNASPSVARARSSTGASITSTSTGNQDDTARVQSKTSIPGPVDPRDIPSKPIPIPPRRKPGELKQTYFDVGYSEGWVHCKECHHYYDSSTQRGRIGHDVEHEKRLSSKVTKREMSKAILEEWESDEKKHRIVVIDRKQAVAVRNHAEAVLTATSEALGQIHVGSDALWSEFPDPQSIQALPPQVHRFCVFVYYINDMPAAVVLAERIRDACSYHPGRIHEDGGSLIGESARVSGFEDRHIDTTFHVWLSVERIWVHANYRRQGLATKMVDIVRENFIRGLPLSKSDIAFSFPFGPGLAFATKYCKEVFGDVLFLVNRDEVRH